MNLATLQRAWFGDSRGGLVSGPVVALVLIPPAIAVAISVGARPRRGRAMGR